MLNNEILGYIKSETAKGTSRQEITDSLAAAGWQDIDINKAFNAVYPPGFPTGESSRPVGKILTEKDFPITVLWIFKSPIVILVLSIVGLFLGVWFPYMVILFPILLIANPLIRANFHYSTQEKFFVVRQGVLSKKQRNLPYGVIQNVLVKQDLFDRIFRLATLRVENAVQGEGKGKGFWSLNYKRSYRQADEVGSSGNAVNIPGMKKSDAEALKVILLERMKENPIEDSQSGL